MTTMNDSRVVEVAVPPDGDLQKIELSRRRTVEDLKQKLLVLNYKLPGTKTDYKLLYNDIDLEDSKIFCESHPEIAATWNEDSIVLVTLFSKNPLPAHLFNSSPRASIGVEPIERPRRLSIGDVPTSLTLQTPAERMAWLEERRKSRGGELSNSLKQLQQQWQKEEEDLKIKDEERKKRREEFLVQQKVEEEEFKKREEERQRIRLERETKRRQEDEERLKASEELISSLKSRRVSRELLRAQLSDMVSIERAKNNKSPNEVDKKSIEIKQDIKLEDKIKVEPSIEKEIKTEETGNNIIRIDSPIPNIVISDIESTTISQVDTKVPRKEDSPRKVKQNTLIDDIRKAIKKIEDKEIEAEQIKQSLRMSKEEEENFRNLAEALKIKLERTERDVERAKQEADLKTQVAEREISFMRGINNRLQSLKTCIHYDLQKCSNTPFYSINYMESRTFADRVLTRIDQVLSGTGWKSHREEFTNRLFTEEDLKDLILKFPPKDPNEEKEAISNDS